MTTFLQFLTVATLTLIEGLNATTFNSFIPPPQNFPAQNNLQDHYDSSVSGISSRFDSGFSPSQFSSGSISGGVYPETFNGNSYSNQNLAGNSLINTYGRPPTISHVSHRNKRALILPNDFRKKNQESKSQTHHFFQSGQHAKAHFSLTGKHKSTTVENELLSKRKNNDVLVGHGQDFELISHPFVRGSREKERISKIYASDFRFLANQAKHKALSEIRRQMDEAQALREKEHFYANYKGTNSLQKKDIKILKTAQTTKKKGLKEGKL